jgi:hypothetical protein
VLGVAAQLQPSLAGVMPPEPGTLAGALLLWLAALFAALRLANWLMSKLNRD